MWVVRKRIFGDNLAVDQMSLDDLLQNFRRAGVIPNAIGIHDRDRPHRAHAQAIDLASVHERLGASELEFL